MPSLVDYQLNQLKVRETIYRAKRESRSAMDSKRIEALNYFRGIDSLDILRAYYANRYAYKLTKSTDATSGTEIYRYARGLAPAAVDAGLYQCLETKTLQRIVRSIATLFTQKDQRFTYTAENGDATEYGKIIATQREAGKFQGESIRTDRVSALLCSSAMRIMYQGGHLIYVGGIGPQVMHVRFPTSIDDNGQSRPANRRDLEDADTVVLQISDSTDLGTNQCEYVAFFGRSQKYPNGRQVSYYGSDPWAIPEVGSRGADDYETPSLGPCNPLTALQNTVDDGFAICPHEYPFIVLYGQDVDGDEVFPETSFSLYDNSVECDLMQSRIFKAADVSARGSIAVKMEQGGLPPDNPDEGVTLLPRGATRDIQAVPSGGVDAARNALSAAQIQLATGYAVPGYEVVSDGTGQPESGIALSIRSAAKRDARRERVEQSRSEINRLFQIERGLLRWFATEDQWIPADVEQQWYPGDWQPPTPQSERVIAIQAELAMGAIDYVEAVRQIHDLATRDEAKSMLDQFAEDAREYPNPANRTALRVPPRPATVREPMKKNEDDKPGDAR